MTVLAIVVLAVWALGIVAFAAAYPHTVGDHVELDAAWSIDPVLAGLVSALAIVLWPAALAVAGLVWLADRGRR